MIRHPLATIGNVKLVCNLSEFVFSFLYVSSSEKRYNLQPSFYLTIILCRNHKYMYFLQRGEKNVPSGMQSEILARPSVRLFPQLPGLAVYSPWAAHTQKYMLDIQRS